MMRFEEAYTGWQERRLTQEDAAAVMAPAAELTLRAPQRVHQNRIDHVL